MFEFHCCGNLRRIYRGQVKCRTCGKTPENAPLFVNGTTTSRSRDRQSRQAQHWNDLHSHELTGESPAWFTRWVETIPKQGCDCKNNASRFINQNLPDFTSDRAWFRWGVDFHNHVSREHAGNPTVSLRDALAMYREPAKESDLLVISIGTGPMRSLLEFSRASHERYAKRVGADYIALTNQTESWWGLEKFRVHKFARIYERTLFVDADVWIKRNAPNIFGEVPATHVGMHNDWQWLHKDKAWLANERKQVGESQGVEMPNTRCLNSGVVVCSQNSADIWTRPVDPFPTGHTAEQCWVDYLAEKHPVHMLAPEWNTQHWWKADFDNRFDSAYFLHFAGAKNRMELMQQCKDL